MIAYSLSRFSNLFRFAHKRAVQLDLQGNINEYVRKVSKEIPTLESQKVKVEYIDQNASRSSIISDGNVIIRLRRDDPKDLNFVHGAYFFVSTSLLFRVKRYISQSQRDALDLYVTTRLIEKEKPPIVDHFLEEYLHPSLKDKKSDKAKYYDQLSVIDRGGMFYPVLLEELHFLGSKVFGNRQDDKIVTEVRNLLEFLQNVAQRKVGTEVDLNFKKDYCKSAIMIVGKNFKLTDPTHYINHIRKSLYTDKIETIYVLGNLINKSFIDEVCNAVSEIYSVYRSRKSKTTLNYDDVQMEIDSYIVVLQLIGAPIYHGT